MRLDQRVRPLELLFDVIYVFAFTQVTDLMGEGSDLISILQGLAVFGILWWVWALFTWLSNQHGVDRRSVRLALVGGIVITFVTSLGIPDAFHADGGRFAAFVFAGGFFANAVLFVAVSIRAARDDVALRRQVLTTTLGTLVPVSATLLLGALFGGEGQLITWAAAVVLQALAALATSFRGQWRLPAPGHYAERHQLVVILALGESIISTGAGVAGDQLDPELVATAAACVALTLGLWWAYFHRLAALVEGAVGARDGNQRALLGTSGTYLHLAIVSGILLVALGAEGVMESAHVGSATGPALNALAAGLTLFLASTGGYWCVLSGEISPARFAGAGISLLAVPVANYLPPVTVPLVAAVMCLFITIAESAGWRFSRGDLLHARAR